MEYGLASNFRVHINTVLVAPLLQERRGQGFLQGSPAEPHEGCPRLRHHLRRLRESQCVPQIVSSSKTLPVQELVS